MIKFRLYYDKDAETKWLNEMAEQGWAMKSFFAGFYSFERCEPGQYMYQVDFGNRFFLSVKSIENLCRRLEWKSYSLGDSGSF